VRLSTIWKATSNNDMADWFRRRSQVSGTPPVPSPNPNAKGGQTPAPSSPVAQAATVPEGAFTKCAKCGALLYTKDFERDLKVCAKCGHHHRLSADERIAFTVDEETWRELPNVVLPTDPLGFPNYAPKLADARNNPTKRGDGLTIGTAQIGGNECVLGVVDFGFAKLAGTMGSVFGEKFCRACDEAVKAQIPFVVFCASGGARMQEGLLGLMQMAKTSAAVAQLAEAHVPYVVVLTDPTTGGALASYASLGDVIYAEPGALVAFAGDRVAKQAQTEKTPANYKTAEFQEEHGMVDRVVARKELATTLARTLTFFGMNKQTTSAPVFTNTTGNGVGSIGNVGTVEVGR
jgi:acetyl-CoA carboxylase carboxyl transferase subunit beta